MLFHLDLPQTLGKIFLLYAFKCRNYRSFCRAVPEIIEQSKPLDAIVWIGFKKNLRGLSMYKYVLWRVGGGIQGAALSHPVEGAVFFPLYMPAWVD